MKKLFKKAVEALSDRLISLNYKLEGYPCEPQNSCSEAVTIINDIHGIIYDLKDARDLLDYYAHTEYLSDDPFNDLFSKETTEALSQTYLFVSNAVESMHSIDGIFRQGIT